MIAHPIALAAVLLLIESGILFLASRKNTRRYFDIIPSIFWIYCLPMMASSIGLIPAKSVVYSIASDHLLPMSLFILLFTVDVRAILGLGPAALLMFFIGAAGIGLGVAAAFMLFKGIVGPQFWSGFGALSGSWTGGSANMIAVKEALGTPDAVFLPMVVVDTVVPYVWMGLLIILARHQLLIDGMLNANRNILDDLGARAGLLNSQAQRLGFKTGAVIILAGVAGAELSSWVSSYLPQIKNVITRFAWGIMIVSTLGIMCSFTPAKKLEAHGSNKIGYFILYFVLTTIGAKASIQNVSSAFVLIAAGFVIVAIHAFVLFAAARLMRVPLCLAAAASQANIGGVASAPMVAEVYQKGFASVGLLLAILGNLVGTYIGIAVGQLCRWLG